LDYVDFTLVRLADEASRAALFDQAALEQLALTAYDTDAMLLGGPYTAIFDELVVGLTVPRRAVAEAAWGPVTGSDRREGRWTLLGVGGDAGVRVDALWRGAVVARAVSPLSRIEHVLTAWPSPAGIDEEIVAALGGLPAAPDALEAERRARLLARLRAGFRQPAALGDAVLDAWLRDLGAGSVGELLARFASQLGTAALQLSFSAPPAEEAAAPRRLPIAVAILVRDTPLQLAQLLADSKLVRDHLRELGVERASEPGAAVRQPLVVAWMVPDATFDDADWPGGTTGTPDARRQARRAAAGRWLAREGIGLVTTPAHGPT
jgi:hypothetical protein